MSKWISMLLLAAVMGFGLTTIVGCTKEDPKPAKKVEPPKVDDAAKKVEEKTDDAAKKVEGAADDAAKKVEDATK